MKCQRCYEEIKDGDWIVKAHYDGSDVLFHKSCLAWVGRLLLKTGNDYQVFKYQAPEPTKIISERIAMSTKKRVLLFLSGAILSSGTVWLVGLTTHCGLYSIFFLGCPTSSIDSTTTAWLCTWAWPFFGGIGLAIYALAGNRPSNSDKE